MNNRGHFAIAVGGAALIGLVAWFGARGIGAEIWRAAWVVPLCVGLHAGQLGLSAMAWRALCGRPPPPWQAWWRIRWVREAVNSMLPLAHIAGNLAGVRLLAAGGAGQARAAAGTVLDLTVEAATLAGFTLAGIVVLAAIVPDGRWLPWVAGSTAGLCLGVAGFVAAQRFGLLRWIEAAANRLRRWLPQLDLSGLQAAFAERRRDSPALLRAAGLHAAAWVLGVGESWLILTAIGLHPGLGGAFVVESLGMAARSAGFAVPAALGVQEAGYVLVGGLVGIPADVAVALSMLKRARELVVGVAGLIAWQRSEALLRRRVQPATPEPRSVDSRDKEAAP